MTGHEWIEIVRRIRANWPHAQIPDVSLAKWYDDLRSLPADTVLSAVEALYRNGREFPPNGAQILAEVAEQTVGAPSFGDAWRRLQRAVRNYGRYRPQELLDSLADAPAVQELARQIGVRELCMAREGDTTTFAQARERYASILRSQHRTITHAGLPAAVAPREITGPRPVQAAVASLVDSLTLEGPA